MKKTRIKDAEANHSPGKSFNEYIADFKEVLIDCPDLVYKKVYLEGNRDAFFIYLNGLVDINLLQRDLINPILLMSYSEISSEGIIHKLPTANMKLCSDITQAIADILEGYAVFIGEDINFILTCKLTNFEKRNIEEPITEKNIRGPHEGFVETIDTNITILRRRIKNSKLKFKSLTIGTVTNQKVAIAYIDDICNPDLLNTLYHKINSINFDGIIAIGYIEQFITDFKYSPFPQYQATERPDKAVAALLEGRFVVIQEGTPVAIIAPVNFFSFFQALDDFSTNWMFGSFIRFIRIIGAITAILLPALYIAITSFHYYMVPLNLLVPLAESRARVPFPPIIEALILEITLEMLREASVRLPTYVGISIGVVGGLVIGQAAVEAGIVSDLFIIIVAVTAIASFLIPTYDMGLAVRLMRFIFMILAAIFGIIGIVICSATMFAHLLVIESLGQPYFQPVIPFKPKDLLDVIVRFPIGFLKKRPSQAKPRDNKRGRDNG